MKIKTTPIIARNLQPGDLYSTENLALNTNQAEDVGFPVYIRTDAPADNAMEPDSQVFLIEIERESQPKIVPIDKTWRPLNDSSPFTGIEVGAMFRVIYHGAQVALISISQVHRFSLDDSMVIQLARSPSSRPATCVSMQK